jgi:hypothetical protein
MSSGKRNHASSFKKSGRNDTLGPILQRRQVAFSSVICLFRKYFSWSRSITVPLDNQLVKTVSFWSRCVVRWPLMSGERGTDGRSMSRGKLPPLKSRGGRCGGVPFVWAEVRDWSEVLPTRLSEVPRRSTMEWRTA